MLYTDNCISSIALAGNSRVVAPILVTNSIDRILCDLFLPFATTTTTRPSIPPRSILPTP